MCLTAAVSSSAAIKEALGEEYIVRVLKVDYALTEVWLSNRASQGNDGGRGLASRLPPSWQGRGNDSQMPPSHSSKAPLNVTKRYSQPHAKSVLA